MSHAKTDKILLVDDDNDTREVIAIWLAASGFSVSQCADAARARETLAPDLHAFDLLIFDVGLPGESGLELLGWLCDECEKAREAMPLVAMLTATGDPVSAREEAFDAGARALWSKPIGAAELLENVMALRRAGETL